MKQTRDERHVNRRAIILTCALLVVFGAAALARQDTSPPYLSLDPGDLDFGEQVVGRWSRARRITVTNTGGQPLAVDSVEVGGDDARNFSVVKDTCTGAKVSPYRACTVDVSFAPSKTEGFEAELKLIDNAVTSPQTMRLRGDGINSSSVPAFDED